MCHQDKPSEPAARNRPGYQQAGYGASWNGVQLWHILWENHFIYLSSRFLSFILINDKIK